LRAIGQIHYVRHEPGGAVFPHCPLKARRVAIQPMNHGALRNQLP